MGAALCTGLGSPDFILEATRMAGIFSLGFGFPSTSLAAAAEATAKGSAGSRAGAGPRPARRPPTVEEKTKKKTPKNKIPGSGNWGNPVSAPAGWRASHCPQQVPPARMSQREGCSEALGSRGRLPLAILLLGN